MKRQIVLLLLFPLSALPALAKDAAVDGGGCPAAAAEVVSENRVAAEPNERPAARPASTDSAPRSESRNGSRDRPRWHSFIPGMIR